MPSSFPRTTNEFVAVVLAATPGARLFPLTSSTSKHMLPVGGKPVLMQLLSSLVEAGFQECILALSTEDTVTIPTLFSSDAVRGGTQLEQVGPMVYRFESCLQIAIHVLSEGCAGSAEALREIHSSNTVISSAHWVVLPGDLVVLDATVLRDLVDRHRLSQNYSPFEQQQQQGTSIRVGGNTMMSTACTVLLANVGEQDEHGVPLKESAKQKKGGLARDEEDIEYIALSSSLPPGSSLSSPRIVWKQSKIDVEQDEDLVGQTPKLTLPKSRLRSVVRVTTDWTDLHVYVLSSWVLSLLQARSSTTVSLQGDVLPLLVARQYRGVRETFGSFGDKENAFVLEQKDEEYAVRAHVLDGWKALRVATIPSYLYACREVISRVVEENTAASVSVKLPPNTTVNVKFHSILMEGATLGEKVTCKSSTIGRNATVSNQCRLNNVVVMDKVKIGENCVLQNSILGAGCVIGENCNLNDCQVAPGKLVPAGTKEKGESLMDVV